MGHTNLILATDSYKLTHWNQYPKGTEAVYSYLESRRGAALPYTVFFGLQSIILQYLHTTNGDPLVTMKDVEDADQLAKAHFGRDLFNRKGWEYIAHERRGRIPLRIRAVPEGTPVPINNVLMTVENTDPRCFWLTNALESLLTHVWYPSTVATVSRHVKASMASFLESAGAPLDGLPFMLHDFGFRGASSYESAAIGGAGHLVNFKGTDTLPAMELALRDYEADPSTLAFSVPATEHSVMTALGPEGEYDQIDRALIGNRSGILSVVGDSYNIYEFVCAVGDEFKDAILERDGVFVVRPDSVTREHPNPATLVAWILHQLWHDFGGTETSKGFKVLDPHVRVLWGDGIDPNGIEKIIGRAMAEGFSPENLVFGMGGGLLQKVNRDTQRFAFKCSAQKRDGKWHDVWKDPVDSSKKSKRGRLILARDDGDFVTRQEAAGEDDQLQYIYGDGYIYHRYTFDEVRQHAELPQVALAK